MCSHAIAAFAEGRNVNLRNNDVKTPKELYLPVYGQMLTARSSFSVLKSCSLTLMCPRVKVFKKNTNTHLLPFFLAALCQFAICTDKCEALHSDNSIWCVQAFSLLSLLDQCRQLIHHRRADISKHNCRQTWFIPPCLLSVRHTFHADSSFRPYLRWDIWFPDIKKANVGVDNRGMVEAEGLTQGRLKESFFVSNI